MKLRYLAVIALSLVSISHAQESDRMRGIRLLSTPESFLQNEPSLSSSEPSAYDPTYIEEPVESLPHQESFTAKIRVLNKKNDDVILYEVNKDDIQPIGDALTLIPRYCLKNHDDQAANDVALINVYDARGLSLYSGWIYSQFRAATELEHPVYKVTLVSCS